MAAHRRAPAAGTQKAGRGAVAEPTPPTQVTRAHGPGSVDQAPMAEATLSKRTEKLQLMLNDEELRAIDDWRFANRLPSRAAAIRELLRRGLGAERVQRLRPRRPRLGRVQRGRARRALSAPPAARADPARLTASAIRPFRAPRGRLSTELSATLRPASRRPKAPGPPCPARTRSAPPSSTTSRATVTRSWPPARSCRTTTRRCCSPTPAWSSSRTSSPALEQRPYRRAATSQKCVRAGGKHNDLDNVGYTARHHTFFEMLGNFSFGDYFKDDAIELAWELVTEEYGLPADRLLATVYAEDDEAFELWRKIAGLPESRIIRIPTSDNFWRWATPAPAALLGDLLRPRARGRRAARPAAPDEDGDRFIEIWNLVFMQFEQLAPRRRASRCPALDRHRHGPRAHRRGAPGPARQLRHRPVPPLIAGERGADRHAGRRRRAALAQGDRRPPARRPRS